MSQTPEIAFDAVSRIHLVGVGGAGMSALAKLLAGRGRIVTGSDLRGSEMLTRLSELGVDTWAGHRPESLGGVDLVVASSAVPEADAGVAETRAERVRVREGGHHERRAGSEQARLGATGSR